MSFKDSLWNSASHAGLTLGSISILYLLLSALTNLLATESKMPGFVISLFGFLFWIVKIVACIYFMRRFMIKFSNANPKADNSRVFKFGALSALLSALVYSGFYLAYVLFIAPDAFAEAFELMKSSPLMDSNTLEAMDQLESNMPSYSFFANLIYCTLFGTILSAILSANIPPKNPFKYNDDSKIDEQ